MCVIIITHIRLSINSPYTPMTTIIIVLRIVSPNPRGLILIKRVVIVADLCFLCKSSKVIVHFGFLLSIMSARGISRLTLVNYSDL